MSTQKKPLNALRAVLDRQAAKADSAASKESAASAAPLRSRREPQQKAPRAKALPVAVSSPHYRPSRTGKRLIGGHFSPDIAKHLKILATEEDTSVQALLEEALDLLFVKKGKGHIGRV